jgi:hypothetical protein
MSRIDGARLVFRGPNALPPLTRHEPSVCIARSSIKQPPGGCPLLAQNGHAGRVQECPLSGVNRTSGERLSMFAYDQKRKSGVLPAVL